MYQEAADIRDVYLYKKFAVQVGSWYTEGGGGGRAASDIRDVYLYKKFAVQVGSWYTGGGNDVL